MIILHNCNYCNNNSYIEKKYADGSTLLCSNYKSGIDAHHTYFNFIKNPNATLEFFTFKINEKIFQIINGADLTGFVISVVNNFNTNCRAFSYHRRISPEESVSIFRKLEHFI